MCFAWVGVGLSGGGLGAGPVWEGLLAAVCIHLMQLSVWGCAVDRGAEGGRGSHCYSLKRERIKLRL
jgi:hypothetical protein